MRKGNEMILISIEGGTKTQRNLGDSAIRFFVKKLMPRKRSLAIDLQIKNLIKDDVAGLCEHIGRNEVLIESHNRGTLYDYISFLAHESIHMKQFVTGELKTVNRKELWHGEDFTDVPYKKQPWEIEAWDGQHELSKDFIKNKMGITLKVAKELSPRTLKQMDWNAEALFLHKIVEAQVKKEKKRK
jgi:hypothetical protein